MRNRRIINTFTICLLTISVITGCGSKEYIGASDGNSTPSATISNSANSDNSNTTPASTSETSPAEASSNEKGTRDNTPVCLIPEAPGTVVYENEYVTIDATNASQGYICAEYKGTCPKVKMQITCPSSTIYTYLLGDGQETFPLTTDSGAYSISVFENTIDTQYSTVFRTDFEVNIEDSFGPYLYPNQYVKFTPESNCVAKGAELAYSANSDLDVVTNVYNYVIGNIKYDTEFANVVESGYTPTPDNTLASGKGICLDYSALMASMLRSQTIPTHMEVGFAGSAYHAWISVYLDEIGWVNGIIEFDGTSWNLMDPTMAANSNEAELKKFIGDGSNYETKYIY